MIEGKKSLINYFSVEDIEIIHSIVSRRWEEEGEPIPPLRKVDKSNLESLVNTPKATYMGVDLYPTLEEKAAIIFYTINKKHIFINGNKRISVACLLIFLSINGKTLDVNPDDLTKKALFLANTTHEDNFDNIKDGLVCWIKNNTKDL